MPHLRLVVPLAVLVAASVSACGGSTPAAGAAGSSSTVNLVAYSTPQKVYAKIIPQFQQTPAGKDVRFTQSYGASGSQARAVVAGQPADVVEFSLAPDVGKLVKAGLVDKGWSAGQYKGILTDSVAVLVVRKGNPKHIRTWEDLVRPDVKVVTPNPFSSGSAQWNLMAAYGAQVKTGHSPQQALDFLRSLLKNTAAQPESGSKATAAFVAGTGDVLISYENEAIEAQQAGKAVDYVIPDQTILIENPVAVVSTSKNKTAAQAFVDYLYTAPAQQTFAAQGYRPVVKAYLDAGRFPTPSGLFTIDDLGGWTNVRKEFFDPATGSIAKIEASLGVSGG